MGVAWEKSGPGNEKVSSVPLEVNYKFSMEGDLLTWDHNTGMVKSLGNQISIYEEDGDAYQDSVLEGGI